ncbi:hypothetical protein TVAG_127570 [Trichomonas vaginalis G3]|uniref:Uncharacterized protein n=1 Tax=Trichomonas vaginalis (strain ATCC PRA-98 / G3) TaxID=412133 RepID=A2G9U9_TRIV3|nr:hypothetical protein TVAGG3_0427450 [Trichomonas vaginalis G3]EAX86067.1 hypothetical protein TVAG_127570 [Trichomonas vaginalis G3]KAI5536514.1 hypothetical protein TVAGG3_0427450 [Trichomonas vaginalis G3]|eukprot:XP_001298997.1 hypothetical protein [Trichomonas vaginalis G3]
MSRRLLNQIINESQSSSGTWSYTFMFEVRNILKNLRQNDKVKVFTGLFEVILHKEITELQKFKLSQLLCYIYNSYPEIFKETLATFKPLIKIRYQAAQQDSELSKASYNLLKNL